MTGAGGVKDLRLVVRGLELVVEALVRQNLAETRHKWRNSSLRALPKAIEEFISASSRCATNPEEVFKTSASNVKETQAKVKIFLLGLREYREAISKTELSRTLQSINQGLPSTSSQHDWTKQSEILTNAINFDNTSAAEIELNDSGRTDRRSESSQFDSVNEEVVAVDGASLVEFVHETKEEKAKSVTIPPLLDNSLKSDLQSHQNTVKPVNSQETKHVIASYKKQSLSSSSRERRVPASRISRLISYGSLGVGLGVGALAEVARRAVGVGSSSTSGSILESNPFLTDTNANRIVDTLCRVRGAALKLGQMLSLQDNTLINPQLQAIFERVRQSADFMPSKQMKAVMIKELGQNWKSLFSSFEDQPFAAASIGQVHRGMLPDGTEVAVKIQYPGVAKGIDSDIDNLLTLMNVWNILPKGLYIENLAVVARKELKWEVDYKREAECARKFKKLVEPYPQFYVPEIINDLSTERVLTSELIYGTPIDKLVDADQALRNWICQELLRLALLEIFQFNFMQTDPNWSNFFYNDTLNKLNLLDFGACREYSKFFVDHYLLVIKGAIAANRAAVLQHSTILGFMTGYESKMMEDAHVEAAMVLGEPFRHQGCFDFSHQETTRRLHSLIPVMVQQRLTPPPEESYSIHRKLSGVFLLCTRLKANVDCSKIFHEVLSDYKFDPNSLT